MPNVTAAANVAVVSHMVAPAAINTQHGHVMYEIVNTLPIHYRQQITLLEYCHVHSAGPNHGFLKVLFCLSACPLSLAGYPDGYCLI